MCSKREKKGRIFCGNFAEIFIREKWNVWPRTNKHSIIHLSGGSANFAHSEWMYFGSSGKEAKSWILIGDSLFSSSSLWVLRIWLSQLNQASTSVFSARISPTLIEVIASLISRWSWLPVTMLRSLCCVATDLGERTRYPPEKRSFGIPRVSLSSFACSLVCLLGFSWRCDDWRALSECNYWIKGPL